MKCLLMRFWCFFYRLHLNDKHYFVEPPKREKISSEEIAKLGDVRSMVGQVKLIYAYFTLLIDERSATAANQQIKL